MTEATKSKSGGCLKWIGIVFVIFVALVILGAIVADGDTGKSNDTQKLAVPVEEIKVDSPELARAYSKNEVSAQAKYGGRPLAVTGVIESITLDFSDDPVIALQGAQMFQNPQASFTKADAAAIGELEKGQIITVHCEKVGEVIGTPMLEGCKLE